MPHSPLANPSATLGVLESHGLRTKKGLGQNFLVDDNVVGRVLALADLSSEDVVLEVGPGIGTLTVALCRAAAAVIAVEQDAALLPVLDETAAGCVGLRVIRADAIEVEPATLSEPPGPPTAFVANLPYGVAATVVLRFFESLPSLRHATVMVQREVAERMAAEPGGKDYGAYTVKLRLLVSVAGRFPVSRTCFLPSPRVDSAVVRLERRAMDTPSDVLEDAAAVATAAFAQRRKTVRNSVASSLDAPVDEIEKALVDAGIDGGLRAEALSVEDYLGAGAILRKMGLLP